jgi:hypothetical protein
MNGGNMSARLEEQIPVLSTLHWKLEFQGV